MWVGSTFVNDYLVRQGYAQTNTVPPNIKYAEKFVEAQREARENNRGLWSACESETEQEVQNEREEEQNNTQDETICSYNAYNCLSLRSTKCL